MAAFIKHPPQHFRCPVPGCSGVDSAAYGLPCQRHACKRKTCPRQKAEGSGYCVDHACDLVACSKSRLDTSAFCNLHACQYFQCRRCKRGVGTTRGAYGDACEEHTCQADGCLDPRRHQRPYCKSHSCGWAGRMACSQAVEAGTMACRDHVCRYEEGCANVRKVKSNSTACDDHTCAAPKCYGAVGLRGRYCRLHTCLWDPCSKKSGVGGSSYCETHKCELRTCSAPVASKVDWLCKRHKEQSCARDGCDTVVERGRQFCVGHTCTHTPSTGNEPPCMRGRRVGGRYCDMHSCDRCNKPRLPDLTRCASHSKIYSRDHPQWEYHKRRDNIPSGLLYAEEDLIPHEVVPKRRVAKSRSPPPHPGSTLPPERAVELATATKERGALTTTLGRPDLIPSTFRADANQAVAYGCGFRDACHHMADLMTMQMETMEAPRPLSPSRHVAKIDGPRFTQLVEDGF